jgi:hypothetical protein
LPWRRLRSFAVLGATQDDRFLTRWRDHQEVGDALGVEVDFATVFAREAIEQFGEGSLCAVLAINERSDDR